MNAALFFLASVISLAGGLGVIMAHTPLRSAMALLACWVGVSFSLFLLEAPYLGTTYLLLAGSSILVVMLFVFMTVDPTQLPRVFRGGIGLLRSTGLLAAGVLLYFILDSIEVSTSPTATDGSLVKVGDVLLLPHVFLFTATGLLLMVALVAAVLFTQHRP